MVVKGINFYKSYYILFYKQFGIEKKLLIGKEVGHQIFMIYIVLIQNYTLANLPKNEHNSCPRTKLLKKVCKDNDYLNDIIKLDKQDNSNI